MKLRNLSGVMVIVGMGLAATPLHADGYAKRTPELIAEIEKAQAFCRAQSDCLKQCDLDYKTNVMDPWMRKGVPLPGAHPPLKNCNYCATTPAGYPNGMPKMSGGHHWNCAWQSLDREYVPPECRGMRGIVEQLKENGQGGYCSSP
jgi:hypothetical protein